MVTTSVTIPEQDPRSGSRDPPAGPQACSTT